jgi:lysophospholipase L1-like esterase
MSLPRTTRSYRVLLHFLLLPASALRVVPAEPAPVAPVGLAVAGEWAVEVTWGDGDARKTQTLKVIPPRWVAVDAETHTPLPVFNPRAGGWLKGVQLRGVRAQETTTPFLLDPSSLVLRAGPESSDETFERGKDFEADTTWGTVGRLAGGRIKEDQAVYVSYRYGRLRLDSIIRRANGRLELHAGEPRAAAPLPPPLAPRETRLANIWLPGMLTNLTAHNLFPILESNFPEPTPTSPTMAELRLPKTMAKLRSGGRLRVLAWGDSVTDGSYVPKPARDRWQEQFVARLRERHPTAIIELVTEAWGGRNTHSYTNEPPGSPHHYGEKVLGARPDLIVSEFVNDAGLSPQQVEDRYRLFLEDFTGIGAEWIILTPHYVRPDWMGLNRERDIDADPRPYVTGLRQFAARHHVALADASLRYGRLWRQGLPYTTLMLNSINHPDTRGMKIFADALMELFPR